MKNAAVEWFAHDLPACSAAISARIGAEYFAIGRLKLLKVAKSCLGARPDFFLKMHSASRTATTIRHKACRVGETDGAVEAEDAANLHYAPHQSFALVAIPENHINPRMSAYIRIFLRGLKEMTKLRFLHQGDSDTQTPLNSLKLA